MSARPPGPEARTIRSSRSRSWRTIASVIEISRVTPPAIAIARTGGNSQNDERGNAGASPNCRRRIRIGVEHAPTVADEHERRPVEGMGKLRMRDEGELRPPECFVGRSARADF